MPFVLFGDFHTDFNIRPMLHAAAAIERQFNFTDVYNLIAWAKTFLSKLCLFVTRNVRRTVCTTCTLVTGFQAYAMSRNNSRGIWAESGVLRHVLTIKPLIGLYNLSQRSIEHGRSSTKINIEKHLEMMRYNRSDLPKMLSKRSFRQIFIILIETN